MKRIDCLKAIGSYFNDELVVTNVGGVRHEWYATRPHAGNFHLLNLGLASSVGLGLALALPHRKVVVFDGDGSLLLNLGSLATIANQNPSNLIYVVFDNSCYESSRGAPTATAGVTDLAVVAKGAGFVHAVTVKKVADFEKEFLTALRSSDLHFIVAKVEVGVGKVPPAPFEPQENKYAFIRYVEKTENVNILDSPPPRAYDMQDK